MKGSVFFRKDRGRFGVSIWLPGRRSPVKIYRLQDRGGAWMPLYHRAMADQLLAEIRAEFRRCEHEKAEFRIEKWTAAGWTDICELYESWLENVVEKNRTPGTAAAYRSYYKNYFKPFFQDSAIQLHQINLDVLYRLKNSIPRAPKYVFNILNALHKFMDYAHRAGKLPQGVPPFPKKDEYGLVTNTPQWLTREEHEKVLAQIPAEHLPIFLWSYYHLRRVGEACALYKTDYDVFNDAFFIRRGISARRLIQTTKTHKVHVIPCKNEFRPVVKKLIFENPESPFMFVNPRARREGKRYTHESLKIIWYAASDQAGVRRVWVYQGTKHTGCTHFIENGGTIDELQIVTDHVRRESVLKYADITLRRKREMLNRPQAPAELKIIKK